MTHKKKRPPSKAEIEHARQVELYEANVESAIASDGSILDVDPTEFGLPEDYDDGERYFAHAMSKDD
jgi:hypothetical protein